MPLTRYTKAASERKRYQIDYTNWLDAGELAVSVVFAVLNNTGVTPLLVDGVQVLPSGLGVQYYVAGGADGTTYNVTATLTTSTSESQIKMDTILFTVREP
jgi:hypothetical protein